MADGQKLKVFISYSRKDGSNFADELVAGLELAGFAPFLDRHDIAAGEDWETRLGGLIHESDTVVYVISPEAVKSERCGWEVDKTLTLSKRLIPVIYKPVSDADIPERLRRLQFIRFDGGLGITRPLAQLAEALRQDLDWIREHTRIAELAARWEARRRPTSLLLRGDDLAAARGWVEKRKSQAPEITEIQGAFLNTSISESRVAGRQRFLVRAVMTALVAAVVIGTVAWWKQLWLMEQAYWLTHVRGHVLTAAQERALKPKETFTECINCPEMVVVPAGTFVMGSPVSVGDPYEQPQHTVTIARAFAVAKFAVTFDEWDACVGRGACGSVQDDRRWGRGSRPVINVSWDDAQSYVAWLVRLTGKRYRLLTEAEFEYAARAGTQTNYPWGDDVGKNNANCDGCGSEWDAKMTAPVGSFKPNAFALFDMNGNVGQWVEDCFQLDYSMAPTDGSPNTAGVCNSRVFRGGSAFDKVGNIRSAHRAGNRRTYRVEADGFRVARDIAP
jgi:formylglycine-generating enzyme required for sulfatase activity